MNARQSDSSNQGRMDLFWLSAVALFFELVAIRWLSSEIRAFSIFKNFPLIACYVGFGYGLMRGRENGRLFKLFPIFLLALVAIVASCNWTGMTDILMPGMRVGGGLFAGWWDASHPVLAAAKSPLAYTSFSFAVFFGLFVLIAATMAGLGQQLGTLFDEEAPLQSYLYNLLGSAAGIAAFSILSFLCTPPLVWLSVGCLAAMWAYRRDKVGIAVLLAVVVVAAAIPAKSIFSNARASNKVEILWSPYHRVEVAPLYIDDGKNQVGYEIAVNKAFFQQPLNLTDKFMQSQPPAEQKRMEEFRFDQYELPYFFVHPRRLLIMGSGTGNDVASALKHGVEHIDAVEIDPKMVELGRKLHPEHPYDSPRVTVYVNDARAFLRQHKDKYDLVMTGFLDSHAVAGNSLSVRLDDYVYTVDGMRDAMAHVSPGGVYCITYCAVADFLSRRLIANQRVAAESVGAGKPLILDKKGGAIWHLLVPVTDQMRKKVPELTARGFEDSSDLDTTGVNISTDDWPFLYLNPIAFDPLYTGILACILLLAWASCGASIRANRSPRRWHLFFLGAAFLLLELAIIDRLSLVFGTTWIVNSICIFAVLAAVIGANILIIKRPSLISVTSMYIGLLGSLVILYLVPLQTFNSLGMWIGGSIAAILSAVPVFFAGLIFSTSFSLEDKPSVGLAFNMLGAVIGGLLEYIATYTGIRSLLLVAAAFYLISWLIWNKGNFAAQHEIARNEQ